MKLSDLNYDSPNGQETALLACGCEYFLSNGDLPDTQGLHEVFSLSEILAELLDEQYVRGSRKELEALEADLTNMGFAVWRKGNRLYYS